MKLNQDKHFFTDVKVWAWFLGAFGCVAIAASVAGMFHTKYTNSLRQEDGMIHNETRTVELVSAYPTSGGIYTSTAFVIPEKYRASVTFVTAWYPFSNLCRCRLALIS